MSASRRLVLVGSILADITLRVPAVPAIGDDVLCTDASMAAGGGFNVLAAARRQGAPAAYAGRIGSGAFGDRISDALAAEAIDLLQRERTHDLDSGFCVVLVDASGERTMVTSVGADAHLTDAELDAMPVVPEDLLSISGYDLAYPHGHALGRWLRSRPREQQVILDPGPLAADLPADLLEGVLDRCTWMSLNGREAIALGGGRDPIAAGRALLGRSETMRGVVVRLGGEGCVLITPEHETRIQGFRANALDTTGAGDCHVGVFCAGLLDGLSPADACRRGNAAAAIAVSRPGQAAAPTRAETDRLLSAAEALDVA